MNSLSMSLSQKSLVPRWTNRDRVINFDTYPNQSVHIMHGTKGMSLMWYQHYSLFNNLVALHEKHPIILPTLFPPNSFSFSLLIRTVCLFNSFLFRLKTNNHLSLLFLSGKVRISPLSLSLWAVRFFDHQESTLNPTSKVCSPSPAHIHNFFRSCMRCLITFTESNS